MTEEFQDDIGLQNQTESTEIETATPEPVVETQETMEEAIPKSKVNEIVHQRTREASMSAYERGKREAAAEYERQRASQAQSVTQSDQPTTGFAQSDIERIKQEVIRDMEATRRANDERQYYENIASQFISKVDAGKSKYSDFDERLASLELGSNLDMVVLANSVENTADVIYELSKDGNEHQLAEFLVLLDRSPAKARSAMQRYSDRVKTNQNIQNQSHAKEPLSKVSASSVGLDSGSMSIRDYQNQDWLRG